MGHARCCAVLVLVGTVALAPLMKTNFLGDSGQNTFTVTQTPAGRHQPRRRGRRGEAGRDDAARHRRHRHRAGSRSARADSALRDAFSGGGGGRSPTRSRPTATPTRSHCAKTVRRPSPTSTTSATIDGRRRWRRASARATSRSTSRRRDRRRSQEATDAVVSTRSTGARRHRPGLEQPLGDRCPTSPVAVDRDAAAAARSLARSRSVRSSRSTMQPQPIGSVEIDDTALTVYLAASEPPTTLDELRQLRSRAPTGPIPLEHVATVEQSDGPDLDHDRSAVSAPRPSPSTPSHRRPRLPRRAAVTTALDDVDAADRRRRRRSAASSRSSRTRSRSWASRCSPRS